MPLSKARNRERMRINRLHKAISTPQESKAVQPKTLMVDLSMLYKIDTGELELDADGNIIPDYE